MYSVKSKNLTYLTLIPLILLFECVLKSDYELKIQKQYLHLRFMWTILIHIESAFKCTQ